MVHHGLVVRIVRESRLFGAAIPGADVEVAEAGEHVELGDREMRERVDPGGIAQREEADPAAAPRAAGRRAVLPARLAQGGAEVVVELGRERARADAGRV